MNLKVGEDTIHYLEFGKGKALVLIPSLWVTSTSYVALGQALAAYYHVYIPDIYRGKSEFKTPGFSIDDYVLALGGFIRRLKLKEYYLIGVSLSGIIASKYVSSFAHKPKKMFLISTTVLPLRIRHERTTLCRGYIMLLCHNMFSLEGHAKNWLWITDGLGFIRRHFRQAWMEGLIATSLKIENIKQLPIPTKLVFALRDEFIPREAVSRLSKVKNLSVETIDGYHGWFFGHEQELVKNITGFFTGDSREQG